MVSATSVSNKNASPSVWTRLMLKEAAQLYISNQRPVTMPAAIDPLMRAASMEPRENEYDDAVDDFLRDIPMNNTSRNQAEPVKDIDEEIKVRKKRTPIPKLDETLLLSDKGIPKLRKVVKTRLRFKGKGHEFHDMAKLLNTYQLWLDDLYPRAKFRDALTMVEKLGHGKRMQVTRKGWIDESKPHRKEDSPERQHGMDEEMVGTVGQATDDRAQDEQANSDQPNEDDDQDMPDEDDLDALLNNSTSYAAATSTAKQRGPFAENSDDEDELAALMAEHDTSRTSATEQTNKKPRPFEHDSDDDDQDDLDALLAENKALGAPSNHSSDQDRQQVQEEEQDDLDALLAEHGHHQVTSASRTQHTEHVHAEDNLEDEEYLDALIAEQEPLKPSEAKSGPDPAKQQRHHLDDVVGEDDDMAGMK